MPFKKCLDQAVFIEQQGRERGLLRTEHQSAAVAYLVRNIYLVSFSFSEAR